MPATPVFGRVEQPDTLNLEPFTFTLVGYRRKKDGATEEVVHEFACSGVRPFGAWLDLLGSTDPQSGASPLTAVIHYIDRALVEKDRARLRAALDDPDVFYEGDTLGAISNWLAETFNERPTRPPSASAGGRSRGGRKSSRPASAKAGATSANTRRT